MNFGGKMKTVMTGLIAILAALALVQTPAAAARLTVSGVSMAQANCIYSPTCLPFFLEVLGALDFTPLGSSAFLQTRTMPGVAGSAAAGKNGYLYRLDLTGANPNSECVHGISIGFGTIEQLNYTGSGPTHLFVITSGGPGTIGAGSAEFTPEDGLVQIDFGRYVCPGQGTFFIGLTSTARPVNATISLWSAGAPPIMQTTGWVP